VSVKTRTGLKQHSTEQWIANLLETKPDAMILHGRTQKMMYAYPADWKEISKAAAIHNEISTDTLVLGNGDVMSLQDAYDKAEEYKLDGIMIGRGIFKNPWIFNPEIPDPNPRDRMEVLLKHSGLFEKTWTEEKNYAIMKRFFKIYTSAFHGASELREKLMKSRNHTETKEIVDKFLY
jgi:tRNA-dihydrouridine synthase